MYGTPLVGPSRPRDDVIVCNTRAGRLVGICGVPFAAFIAARRITEGAGCSRAGRPHKWGPTPSMVVHANPNPVSWEMSWWHTGDWWQWSHGDSWWHSWWAPRPGVAPRRQQRRHGRQRRRPAPALLRSTGL